MDKTLIIAEKPSVASDIARALGGFRKKEDFYESEQYVLSSASGHLLTIRPPEGCEPQLTACNRFSWGCFWTVPASAPRVSDSC